ncbi:MAG TPA: hypothetical protein P5044_11280, partial [bacterium]|nr:hypothetical protein [bacterium]
MNKISSIILLFFLFWSCTSCNINDSKNDSDEMTDSDSDLLTDADISDDLSDEVLTESEDIENDVEDLDLVDDKDFLPDEDFPDENCIDVAETHDRLCFSPRPSDEPCSLTQESGVDHILSRDSKDNYNSRSMGLNDDYYFFMKAVPEYTLSIYRCDRSDGSVQKIVSNLSSMGSAGYFRSFDVDRDYIVFSYNTTSTASQDQSCYLGSMTGDWELKRIAGFKNDCHEPQVMWPYVVYREEYPGWLHIYDIRTGTEKKLEGYKVSSFHHDGKKAYVNAIIGKGDESVGGDVLSKGPFYLSLWEVDLETLEVKPVEIFLKKPISAPYIYGSYIVYGSGREWMLYSGDFVSRNGLAIVLYDLVNRTEKILTDTVTGNSGKAFINYPYAGWVDGDVAGEYGGYQKVVDLETEDEWILKNCVKDMRDPVIVKDYSMIFFASFSAPTSDEDEGICIAEFP